MKELVLIYLILVNVVAFSFMGVDKNRAQKNKWRIPEARLWFFAWIGGSLGSIIGMRIFHHKTKHQLFRLGMPVLLILQLALIFYLIYRT
ncbi:hypothetical protein Pryu01_01340 [Paraliobacillus ryukyuensis]|uniref:Uncharacterized membrane protein YsdA (DUF1294 family) n=1 Tax=Paraliobacillus ryukyuensis TaxID=200904 RepID=A0A366EDE7_9BACI|nr:DUF1294 domain-containing protein [Paraliobacillus ryukyuensis]RBO99428.1 uncharacterized membrane protein YsdA (DUF1294 family) [Paraliobacillus ryukyuensis]